MPRIAATLGVFVLVVGALALNMAQFPIECGAVARPKAADESEQSAPPAEIARAPAAALRPPESGTTAGEPGATEPSEPVQPAVGEVGDAQETDWQAADSQAAETAEYQDRPLSSPAPDEAEAPCCDATGCSLDGVLGMDAEAEEDEPSGGEEAWSSSADIYNPLEPQPEAGTAAVEGAPPEFPGLGAATEAEPGPPYAAAAPPADKEDRDLIPVDPTAAAEAAGDEVKNGVVRLPPVDEAWPSVNADASSPEVWHPSAGD
ncbi:MAG: hypothetical protein ACOCWL_04605 [Thermoguttaceae bacterium]